MRNLEHPCDQRGVADHGEDMSGSRCCFNRMGHGDGHGRSWPASGFGFCLILRRLVLAGPPLVVCACAPHAAAALGALVMRCRPWSAPPWWPAHLGSGSASQAAGVAAVLFGVRSFTASRLTMPAMQCEGGALPRGGAQARGRDGDDLLRCRRHPGPQEQRAKPNSIGNVLANRADNLVSPPTHLEEAHRPNGRRRRDRIDGLLECARHDPQLAQIRSLGDQTTCISARLCRRHRRAG